MNIKKLFLLIIKVGRITMIETKLIKEKMIISKNNCEAFKKHHPSILIVIIKIKKTNKKMINESIKFLILIGFMIFIILKNKWQNIKKNKSKSD